MKEPTSHLVSLDIGTTPGSEGREGTPRSFTNVWLNSHRVYGGKSYGCPTLYHYEIDLREMLQALMLPEELINQVIDNAKILK